jgi:hypothetical protein
MARVHKGGRDVEMRMGPINLGIGTIPPIGKKGIAYVHNPVMTVNVPLVRIGPGNLQGLSLAVRSFEIIHIFCKLVQGVSARGGATHANGKQTGFQFRKGGRNFRFVMFGIGKRNAITVGLALQVYAKGKE